MAATLAGLAILSPLLIACAILVRLTSRGPVLFRQHRVGYLGRLFTILKFRTMVPGAEATGSAVVVDRDARLTCVGTFLRRTKLDELPQLFNILRGDMSIVGPRPRVESDIDLRDPRERLLLTTRPGLTSYASIYHRMEADYCARQADPQRAYRTKIMPQKSLLDCDYVQNLSLLLDLKLIALTCMLVLLSGRSLTMKLGVWRWKVWANSRSAQMLLDMAVYMVAAWLAYNFWFDAGMPAFYQRQMALLLLVVPPVRVAVHRALGVYDLMWRYINVEDAVLLATAFAPVTLALLILRVWLPVRSTVTVNFLVPLGVIALEYLMSLSGALGLRCLRRMLYVLQHHYQPLPEAPHRVLILGAGLLGLSTAMDVRCYPHLQLVGFLDDDPEKFHCRLVGCRVLGNSADLEMLCRRHQVTDVVICAKSMAPDRVVSLRQRCARLGVRLNHVSGLDRLLRVEDDSAPLEDPGLSLIGRASQSGGPTRTRPEESSYGNYGRTE
jgi:lipopolysaccharide/colanic/teichoic acid biosynthesis glycosyltransferase